MFQTTNQDITQLMMELGDLNYQNDGIKSFASQLEASPIKSGSFQSHGGSYRDVLSELWK